MDLSSIAEQVFEELSISDYTSETDSLQQQQHTEENSSSNISAVSTTSSSVNNNLNNSGNNSLTVQFSIASAEDEPLYEIYKQLLDWVDPDSKLFTSCNKHNKTRLIPPVEKGSPTSLHMPSLSVVLFLHEQSGHLGQTEHFLQSRPWKFHHKEWLAHKTQGNNNKGNSQQYYMLTMDRPLCSVRQIHCGKEQIQIRRNVSSRHWKDMVSFYKLIIGKDTVLLKRDLCVFTAAHHNEYDVQLALKRLPKGIFPRKTRKADLCFQVKKRSF